MITEHQAEKQQEFKAMIAAHMIFNDLVEATQLRIRRNFRVEMLHSGVQALWRKEWEQRRKEELYPLANA